MMFGSFKKDVEYIRPHEVLEMLTIIGSCKNRETLETVVNWVHNLELRLTDEDFELLMTRVRIQGMTIIEEEDKWKKY